MPGAVKGAAVDIARPALLFSHVDGGCVSGLSEELILAGGAGDDRTT